MTQRSLFITMSVAAMMVLGAAAALACTAQVYISVTPAYGSPGQSVELFARDMPEDGTARITWERADGSERQTLFEVRGQEQFRRPMTVPDNASSGNYYIVVTGYRDGEQVGQNTAAFEVTASSREGSGDGDPEYDPQGSEGSEPQGSSGSEPEGSSGSEPQGSSGSEPEGSSGSEPQSSEDSQLEGSNGAVPQDNEEPEGSEGNEPESQPSGSDATSQPTSEEQAESSPSEQSDTSGEQSAAQEPTSSGQQPAGGQEPTGGQESEAASPANSQPSGSDTGASSAVEDEEADTVDAREPQLPMRDAPGPAGRPGERDVGMTDEADKTPSERTAADDLWRGLEGDPSAAPGLTDGPSAEPAADSNQMLLAVGAGALSVGMLFLLGGGLALLSRRRRALAGNQGPQA